MKARLLLIGVCGALCGLPLGAQGRGVARDSTPQGQAGQPQRRRALDIRATAPAPEVVTIRPREVPVFERALLAPALIRPPTRPDTGPRTVVIFPGYLPPAAPPAPPSPPRPE